MDWYLIFLPPPVRHESDVLYTVLLFTCAIKVFNDCITGLAIIFRYDCHFNSVFIAVKCFQCATLCRVDCSSGRVLLKCVTVTIRFINAPGDSARHVYLEIVTEFLMNISDTLHWNQKYIFNIFPHFFCYMHFVFAISALKKRLRSFQF